MRSGRDRTGRTVHAAVPLCGAENVSWHDRWPHLRADRESCSARRHGPSNREAAEVTRA